MKDSANTVRKKVRAIAEVRYPAVPGIFDNRGKIIKKIHPEIQDYFQHWQIIEGGILFVNDLETSTREFVISLKRSSVIVEDFATIQEFVDKTHKCFRLMYGVLGEDIPKLRRAAVRLIEICVPGDLVNYKAMVSQVLSKTILMPRDMPLEVNDLFVRIVHGQGQYSVGPVKSGEPWTKQIFKDSITNVPDAGIGIDIDSYVTDIEVKRQEDLLRAFDSIFEVTKSIEESLLRHLGVIDG